jgi:GMP synthase-like glutamine amidotransferase
LKLGILAAGHSPRSLAAFGDYPAMFRRLLGEDAFEYKTYDIPAGEMPTDAHECDAWLVTGASAGVYDPEPWIEPLQGFLRRARGAPMIGVCFGHQVMAQAFGGRVIKSPKGWGVGLQHYEVTARRPWMDDVAAIAVPAWHQDQVVEAPPASTVIAASAFTPIAMLAYDDFPAISIQPHPEFEPAYVAAGLERRKMGLDEDATLSAIGSLKENNDNIRVGGWFVRFLRTPRTLTP